MEFRLKDEYEEKANSSATLEQEGNIRNTIRAEENSCAVQWSMYVQPGLQICGSVRSKREIGANFLCGLYL